MPERILWGSARCPRLRSATAGQPVISCVSPQATTFSFPQRLFLQKESTHGLGSILLFRRSVLCLPHVLLEEEAEEEEAEEDA